MTTQPIELEKAFANHIADKGFLSRIYKELILIERQNSKMGKSSKQTFLQGRPTKGQLNS